MAPERLEVELHIVGELDHGDEFVGIDEIVEGDAIVEALQAAQGVEGFRIGGDILQHLDDAAVGGEDRVHGEEVAGVIDEHRPERGDGGQADFEEGLEHDFGAGLIGIVETRGGVAGGTAVEQFVGANVAIGAVDGLTAEVDGGLRQVLCQALHPNSEIGRFRAFLNGLRRGCG